MRRYSPSHIGTSVRENRMHDSLLPGSIHIAVPRAAVAGAAALL